MKALRFIVRILINKYFLTSLAFLGWMLFFDSDSLIVRNRLQEKLDSLNLEKRYLIEKLRRDSLLTVQLISDTQQIERYARERYQMKKPGEDVFLVSDTTEDQRP